MAKLYFKAVLAGTKKFSEVTALYKPQVMKLLEAEVAAGRLSQALFNELVSR